MVPLDIVDQLIRDEGLKLKPYRDTIGKLTIGVGRNLDDKGITEGEALVLLVNDIHQVEAALRAALPWTSELDPTRLAVLLNMGFNMGVGKLLKFPRFLAFLKSREYAGAAREMLDSKWAPQVGVRARRLAAQMEYGQWT